MIDMPRLLPLDNLFKGSENTALLKLLKLATSRLCRKPVSSKKKKKMISFFLLILQANISVLDQDLSTRLVI